LKLALLDEKHPEYEALAPIWRECSALYHGGAYVDAMMGSLLPQNSQEPPDVYALRKQEASYLSYLGPIVDYFISWLYSGGFTLRPKDCHTEEPIDTDQAYTEFQNDVGGDISMTDFMRGRTTEALVKGASHWLIQMPMLDAEQEARVNTKVMSKEEYEILGLGKPALRAVCREDVYDWATDEHGKLLWVIIHSIDAVRADPRTADRNMVRETWRIYDLINVEVYAIDYEKGKRPTSDTDIPRISQANHRFVEVPLVTLQVNDGLWIGGRIRKPQVEHFRLRSALAWLIRRTCYAMPVIKTADDRDPEIMGSGYYIKLGKEDSFEWTAPPNTPFDVIQKSIDSQRDEIYRVVHQMAQGLSNNAETVGRSADSKQIDTASTRIMLNAYGAIVRKAIEETLEIFSDARGDTDVFWSIEGFNGYDTATVGELIALATDAQILNIPSKTWRKEIKKKIALAGMPEAAAEIKELIRQEIDSAVDSMDELEELDMSEDASTKIEMEEIKAKASIEREQIKSETALKVQESRAQDVLLEVQMANGTESTANATAPLTPVKGGPKSATKDIAHPTGGKHPNAPSVAGKGKGGKRPAMSTDILGGISRGK
jgi:hypothetical protein